MKATKLDADASYMIVTLGMCNGVLRTVKKTIFQFQSHRERRNAKGSREYLPIFNSAFTPLTHKQLHSANRATISDKMRAIFVVRHDMISGKHWV
ncbi:unnamed protein product [Sphenostylis stenocarpa]|uniref:Uncharacterized protein n=1 Tax=Sphenostylis stenocarpa TaxID=92480 RepID=A0AA86SWI0_9FABA|nr:unnamed protein product [Sphenostylis stenocarpa]